MTPEEHAAKHEEFKQQMSGILRAGEEYILAIAEVAKSDNANTRAALDVIRDNLLNATIDLAEIAIANDK